MDSLNKRCDAALTAIRQKFQSSRGSVDLSGVRLSYDYQEAKPEDCEVEECECVLTLKLTSDRYQIVLSLSELEADRECERLNKSSVADPRVLYATVSSLKDTGLPGYADHCIVQMIQLVQVGN